VLLAGINFTCIIRDLCPQYFAALYGDLHAENRDSSVPSTPRRSRAQQGGRLIGHPKQWRRIATRHKKRAATYLAMLTLASIVLWLESADTSQASCYPPSSRISPGVRGWILKSWRGESDHPDNPTSPPEARAMSRAGGCAASWGRARRSNRSEPSCERRTRREENERADLCGRGAAPRARP
jgi:hypothetical protein